MSENGTSPNNVANSLVDEFGGSVVNVLLGGLLLWVGQTTFEQNGEMAGVQQQLESMNTRHQTLHERYDRIVESINNRTQKRFTADDGDKLSKRIDSVQLSTQSLRQQWQDRLSELRVQVSALEVHLQSSSCQATQAGRAGQLQDVKQIQGEMMNIRNDINRLSHALNAVYQQAPPRFAQTTGSAPIAQQSGYQSHAGIAH